MWWRRRRLAGATGAVHAAGRRTRGSVFQPARCVVAQTRRVEREQRATSISGTCLAACSRRGGVCVCIGAALVTRAVGQGEVAGRGCDGGCGSANGGGRSQQQQEGVCMHSAGDGPLAPMGMAATAEGQGLTADASANRARRAGGEADTVVCSFTRMYAVLYSDLERCPQLDPCEPSKCLYIKTKRGK